MEDEKASHKEKLIGTWYAIIAFVSWGFLPLYWKILKQVPAMEILSHRIIWSFIFVMLIIFFNGRWNTVKEVISQPSNWVYLVLSSLLISANWLIYIWAINAGHIVESSLGYYINPLLVVALGVLVLKERLNFWQLISLILATTGVIIITAQFGKVPWISLALATTFALYGLVKKLANLDSIVGLTMETLLVTPAALIYLIYKGALGVGSFGTAPLYITLMLAGAGIVTAMPLLWFAQGAKRIPLSTVGFIQYLSPTISLILGIFVFKEQFTRAHFMSFGFIWGALVIYTCSQSRFMQQLLPNIFKKEKVTE